MPRFVPDIDSNTTLRGPRPTDANTCVAAGVGRAVSWPPSLWCPAMRVCPAVWTASGPRTLLSGPNRNALNARVRARHAGDIARAPIPASRQE